MSSKQILAGLSGVITFMFIWWLGGEDLPTERGGEALMFFFLTIPAAIIGVALYMLAWGIDHDE